MITNEYVYRTWSKQNRKRYENLGYEFTNYGDILSFKVCDLSAGSHDKVNVSCDRCGKKLSVVYKDYISHQHEGKYYCTSCSAILYGIKQKSLNALNKNNTISFAEWCIDNVDKDFLTKYWDEENNNLNPFDITYGSSKEVWLKCQDVDYHQSYKTSCYNFTIQGHRCQYCSSKKTHYKDSVGYKFPRVINIWSDKNKKTPYDYTPYSNADVIWVCDKHGEYNRKISCSTLKEFRCPYCVAESSDSIIETKTYDYLKSLGYSVLREQECSLHCVNPKTNTPLRYDNEVVELRLIIEVNGMQHYKITNFHNLRANKVNTTPQSELEYQKWKDEYKKNYALDHGYFYLEIPYTAYENDEYKTMIDNKIKEIVNRGEFQ